MSMTQVCQWSALLKKPQSNKFGQEGFKNYYLTPFLAILALSDKSVEDRAMATLLDPEKYRLRTYQQSVEEQKRKVQAQEKKVKEEDQSGVSPGLQKGVEAYNKGGSATGSVADGMLAAGTASGNLPVVAAALALKTMDKDREARQGRRDLEAQAKNKQRQQQISVLGDMMRSSQQLGV